MSRILFGYTITSRRERGDAKVAISKGRYIHDFTGNGAEALKIARRLYHSGRRDVTISVTDETLVLTSPNPL